MFDALPEAFGSYRVLEALGMGRFGPVYRAREEATGLFVAIKVFDQGFTPDQAALLADALAQLGHAPLNHPAIVPILAAQADGDRVWVAEPWFDAEALDLVMQRDGTPPLGEALVRITQVAAALDFAAAVGIHHGALHPHDVFVNVDQTVLAGIGVLQALNEAGLAVPMEGAYVSAQRAAGHAVSASDDVFSLGAIAYELVYGDPVPARSELRSAMGVFERVLSPEPADRPATCLALAAAIQESVAPMPVVDSGPKVPVEDSAPLAPAEFESESDAAAPIPSPDTRTAIPIPDARPAVPTPDPHLVVPTPDPRLVIPNPDPRLVIPIPEPRPAVPTSDPRTSAPIPEPPRTVAPTPADLPLRASEPEAKPEARKRVEPESRHREIRHVDPVIRTREPEPATPDEESDVGYWFPISATLAIGLLMGFAGGYVVGQRDATPAPYAAERPVARNQQPTDGRSGEDGTAPTVGRDFTESVVPPGGAAGANPSRGGTQQPATTTPEAAERTAQPDAQPGVIQVDSRPRGARVFLDGRLVGTTPVVVSDVKPGAHAVRIDLRGHRRWVTSVDLAPGERERVAASLER